jgi:DNA-binding XRE family transcriptional regulator
LRDLREAWAKVTEEELARSARVPVQTLKNWEEGRAEPLLSEAVRLATALNSTINEENKTITINELSYWNPEPDDEWLKSTQRQSDARALAFRPRKADEAEDLGSGAKLVREVVERAYQMRVTINRAKAQDHPPPPKRLRG